MTTAPVFLTVRYVPPGAPDTEGLVVEVHAEPGARIALQLAAAPPRPPAADDPAAASQ